MELRRPTDLAVYVRLILSRKFQIGAFAFLVMFLTAFYVYFIADLTFESQAKILIQKPEFITTSPVSTEPVTVKTIANLATDTSLVGELLDRLRSDHEALARVAESMDKNWKKRLPEVSASLAAIATATELQQKFPESDIGYDQAERLAVHSADDIQGILEADSKALAKADPQKFRKELSVDLEVEEQTAYAIKYQPVATLRGRLNTAKAATVLVKIWRDLLLERLSLTTTRVGGETAEDLLRKARNSQARWLTATQEISDFEDKNDVAAIQSEVDSLAVTIKDELRPAYYRLLNESASATAHLKAVKADLDRQSEGGTWIGNRIDTATDAVRMLAHLNNIESATLAPMRRALEGALSDDSAASVIGETTSQRAQRIEDLAILIDTRRAIVNSWMALDSAQQNLVSFLYRSNLETEKSELAQTIKIIDANREALNLAQTRLESASASLVGIEARLLIEPPTKTVDVFLSSSDKPIRQTIENTVYNTLQAQLSETAAEKDAAAAEVKRIETSLRSDTEHLKVLQQRVNQNEKRRADLEQRVMVAEENLKALSTNYLTALTQYLNSQRIVGIINTRIDNVLLNLRELESRYLSQYTALSRFLDELESLRAVAASEKQAYEAIAAKYADAELVLRSQIEIVQKWGEPQEPRLRVSPRRTITCLIAGFLAVVVAMGYILLREIVEPSQIR